MEMLHDGWSELRSLGTLLCSLSSLDRTERQTFQYITSKTLAWSSYDPIDTMQEHEEHGNANVARCFCYFRRLSTNIQLKILHGSGWKHNSII